MGSDLFKVQISLLSSHRRKIIAELFLLFVFFEKSPSYYHHLRLILSHEAFARRGGLDKTGKKLLKQLMKQVDALKVVLSKSLPISLYDLTSENEDFRVHKGIIF